MASGSISDAKDMAFRMIDSATFRKGEEIRNRWVDLFCKHAALLQGEESNALSNADFLDCKNYADLMVEA